VYRRYLFGAALLVVANLAARDRPSPPELAAPAVRAPHLIPITEPELAGSACSVDFLREIQRHPHWTLRIDAYEPRDCGLSPQVRDATLTITEHTATWQRDGRDRYDGQSWRGDPLPERLELSASERDKILAMLEGACAETREPTGRWRLAVAIDQTDDPVTELQSAALEDALAELHDRYTASRLAFAHGLSVHLAYRLVDDNDRNRLILEEQLARWQVERAFV